MTATATLAAGHPNVRAELASIREQASALWGRDFIDLGRSEPLCAWPADTELVGDIGERTRRYPPVEGLDTVRERVGAHYSRILGVPLGRRNVLITPGAVAGGTLALSALCRPGDEVLIPSPHFHLHPRQVELAGGVPRLIDTAVNGWRLTPELLARNTSARTRALLLTNPVNPTTMAYGERQIEEIRAALPPGTAIIADEVYAEYVYEDARFASLGSLAAADGTAEWLILRSASKTLGRPGLRVGAVLGPVSVIAALADRATALTGGVSVPSQLAFCSGLRAAAGADHMRPYRSRRAAALAAAVRLGLTAQRPEGSYYLWLTGLEGRPIGSIMAVAALARRRGVLAWPGAVFGAPTCLRLSLSASVTAIETGLARIAEFAADPS